ncbi:MAG: uvrC, partial [Acidimicrobiales bacterium]|nr:uvrC [Acidimicrobiales bacterium]
MRGAKRKAVRYFGPNGQANDIREKLDLLLRTIPLRSSSDNKFQRHEKLGRPCLLFHIEKCSGPCVGAVSPEQYQGYVDELLEFLDGDTDAVVKRLEAEMREAAAALEFEKAARMRDRLTAVNKAIAKQQMVGDRSEDLDVIGIADDDLEAAVQVFHVRRGRVVGRNGFILDKVEDLTPAELTGRVLEGLYDEPPAVGVPKQVLVPTDPDDVDLYQRWLTEQRGSAVAVRMPQRGDKRTLQETVTNNAKQELVRHRLKRANDHNSRARALNDLQDQLGLPVAPLRIECFDMSHLQGTDYVGSMVVMEDALPKKSEYRKFKIKSGQGNDDFAAMEEVLTRRFTAYLIDRDKPASERGKFAYPPQLLLIDGGKGQLSVATRVLEELGLAGEIPVASLAKRFEEVYVPGQSDPIRIPRQSEALYLLQRVRDESHRFAITFHRQLRDKRMTSSVLDGVAGLGPTRRKRLVKELGGMTAVKSASLEQLQALSWLPDPVALALHDKIHSPGGPSRGGPRRVERQDLGVDRAGRMVGSGEPARAHEQLAGDLAASEAEGALEQADPVGEGERVVQVEPVGERAVLVADALEDDRVGDGGVDLEAVADDAGVVEEPRPVGGTEARDGVNVEPGIGGAERLPLLEDREP